MHVMYPRKGVVETESRFAGTSFGAGRLGWSDGRRVGIDEVTRLDGQEGAIGMVTVYVEAKSAVSNASLTASSSAL